MKIINQQISDKYRVIQKIGEGSLSIVYLVTDISDTNSKYALKLLKEESTTSHLENIIRFNSEIAIAAHLNHENIIKIVDYGRFAGYHYFIMEYIEGSSLDDYMKDVVAFSTEEAIYIIKYLSLALEHIHRNGIIHRDLKPSNILIPYGNSIEKFKHLKLVDFGLSYMMEYGNYDDPDLIIGTFAYMSPEQSGVIKRNVDERSDIYAMGILFYQMLTGNLPFKADNVNSLMHRHIASRPEGFQKSAPGTPEILEKIVFKMIEKEPDKRYQSAEAVVQDLELFLMGYRNFTPGENEKVLRPYFRTELIARSNEMLQLTGIYHRVLEGEGGFCLISGFAGSGKTRLVEELHEYVNSNDGLFLSAKCYPAMTGIPYIVFNDLLNIYLKIFRKKTELEKKKIISILKNEIGDLGEIVIKFNPLMKEILGECPPVIPLENERESKRFLVTISKLFRILGDLEKGLVIQVDDLQWSDEGSVKLLKEMALNIHEARLLMVGIYRSDELGPEHAFEKNIISQHNKFSSLLELTCNPFNESELNSMVRNILYNEKNDTLISEISSFIFRKSHGNPLMSIEIIRQLIQEKGIYFRENRWHFDSTLAQRVNIPSEIIDIIIKRLSLFSDYEKELLASASIFGKKINMSYLFQINEALYSSWVGSGGDVFSENNSDHSSSGKLLVSIIDKAINLQILEKDYYIEERSLCFTHDRIREVLYNLISEDNRKIIHRNIAQMLEQAETGDHKGMIFDILYHYIECGDEDKILQYGMSAGFIAKNNYANEDALRYYRLCLEIYERKLSSGENGSLMSMLMGCRENIGDLYLRTGELTKAIDLYNMIFNYYKSPLKQGETYCQICNAYFKMGDWSRCESFSRKGLRLFGESLPGKRPFVIMSMIVEMVIHLFHSLFPSFFLTKKKNDHDEEGLKIKLFLIANWMYILTDVQKFVRTIIKMLNISESRIGLSKELGTSMAAYASMCMVIPIFKRALRYHENALKIRDSLGDEWGVGQSLQWLGYCHAWQGDYSKSDEHFQRSLAIFRRIGDLWEIGMDLGGISYNAYITSNYERCHSLTKDLIAISTKLNDYYGISRAYQHHAACYIEKGDYKTAEEFLVDSEELCLRHGLDFNLCYNYGAFGYLYLEKGEFDRAIGYFQKAIEMDEKNNFIKYFITFIYPLYAEANLRLLIEKKKDVLIVPEIEIDKIRVIIKNAIKKTKAWVNNYGLALRSKALFYAFTGQLKKADNAFNESVEQFSNYGRKFDTAKSFLMYAMFLRRTDRVSESISKFEAAYRLFVEIGAETYVKIVSALLTDEQEQPGEKDSISYLDRHKLSSIIKISRDITSILNLDELLSKIMENAVEVTGAQRGFLFIKNEDSGSFELKVSNTVYIESEPQYSQNIVDMVARNARAVISSDAENEHGFSMYKSIVRYGLKSILCVPIQRRNTVLGVCYLDNSLSRGVFTDADKDILNVFMTQAAIAIDNAYFYTNLEKKIADRTLELNTAKKELETAYSSVSSAFEIIKEDLYIARKIQHNMLPHDLETIKNLSINLIYHPMGDIGGDIYDVTQLNDDAIRIFLADATGHGIQASLITMVIMSEYNKIKKNAPDPSSLITYLNTYFSGFTTMKIVFSCTVVDIYVQSKYIKFASAGHPTQYLIKDKGIIELDRTGRIIGFIRDSEYKTLEYGIETNDCLLLLTDGLFEHFNERGENYSEARMKKILYESKNMSPVKIYNAINNDVEIFLQNKKINDDDDVTFIGITIQ
ncbi:MAG TPA: SpoIIE family protein phosphatase [Spirochaetota bacterium]|nr:SpoIIE family protein phosphatase [Spirochaetota bacterium]HPI88118.1 SpoIIE family protein phosphatase [Spirochaetota bacterium]HPR46397.1 SpoIIE family protein phosphatase [Spirochaetota bacterium]